MEGLIGIDALYRIKHFQVVKCLRESAIKFSHGFIQFDPAKAFLTSDQVSEIFGNNSLSSGLNSEYHSKL